MSLQAIVISAITIALSAAISTSATIENHRSDAQLIENYTDTPSILRMKGLFDLYDVDVDGYIIPLEMSLFLQRRPGLKSDMDLLVFQLRGIFRTYDVNEDGRLDEVEFLEAAPPESEETEPEEEDALVMFETFDKNGDARLSLREVMETMRTISSTPVNPTEAIRQFELIDINQDSIISYDEFYRALEVIPQSHATSGEQ